MRKGKFLGIDVELLDENDQGEMPEGTLYILIRVQDADDRAASPELRRRRTKTLCDQCSAVCWFDPKSYGKLPAHVERICMQCLVARKKAEEKEIS